MYLLPDLYSNKSKLTVEISQPQLTYIYIYVLHSAYILTVISVLRTFLERVEFDALPDTIQVFGGNFSRW